MYRAVLAQKVAQVSVRSEFDDGIERAPRPGPAVFTKECITISPIDMTQIAKIEKKNHAVFIPFLKHAISRAFPTLNSTLIFIIEQK